MCTHFDPWLLCFTTSDESRTLGTPVVTWKSLPRRAARLALNVRRFITDEGKREIGVGVLGKMLNRYYRDSISSDVQKQLDGVHSHR